MNAKVREHLLSVLLVFTWLLGGCAPGMPIGANEILPMTQQQIVTGVASVFSGQQPIAFMYEHASGLRVLLWPGATNGQQTLWNMVCIAQCAPGWQRIGEGFAMAGQRASEFAQYLKNGGWQPVAPAAAGATLEGMTFAQWLQFAGSTLTGFMVVFPAGMPVPDEMLSVQG